MKWEVVQVRIIQEVKEITPMKRELIEKIKILEQKISKSPNNGGSRFLYKREKMIRFQLLIRNLPQKQLAKQSEVQREKDVNTCLLYTSPSPRDA